MNNKNNSRKKDEIMEKVERYNFESLRIDSTQKRLDEKLQEENWTTEEACQDTRNVTKKSCQEQ